ncbi:MAG: hydrogenase [Geobacter sp.]|nr:hydrogenase [Geobacter sp.]
MGPAWLDCINDPVGSLVAAMVLLAFSGVPGLLIRQPGGGQRFAVIVTLVATLLGSAGAVRILAGAGGSRYLVAWPLPFDRCELAADHLSALFLLPLLLVTACCALYGRAYLPAEQHPATEKRVTLFLGLLAASMVLVLLARNSVLLLIAWELMALSSWVLMATDLHDATVQRSATVYLLATHTGTMVLYLFCTLLHARTGSFLFPAEHSISSQGGMAAVMLLAALIGFGAKAGIMPLHIWLPGAHANAPSHVSALMSGIMLKIGLYGIFRAVSFFQTVPLWFGWLVLVLGGVSAVVGIALATSQRDLKRLLACSSIENIGIIVLGMGMAFVGMATGHPVLIVFGLTGAFLHLVNHALFKPLLFLGSGVIIHAAGTRQIDRMGGLSRLLPGTSLLFLAGSLAVCGLPPFNGFIGKLFLYLAAFHEGIQAPLPFMAFTAPLLAVVGGLSVITFVKLYGLLFLGSPRTPDIGNGHEAPPGMLVPMVVPAVLCLLGGVAAPLLARLVMPVVSTYSGLGQTLVMGLVAPVPLRTVSIMNGLLLGGILLIWLIWHQLVSRRPVASADTWGCGFAAPTARMQYTGSAFAELSGSIFSKPGSPAVRPPPLQPLFALPFRFCLASTERILDRLLLPALSGVDWCFSWLRRMQSGHLSLYMLYIVITLFVLMVWSYL